MFGGAAAWHRTSPGENRESESQETKQNLPSGMERVISQAGLKPSEAHCHATWWLIIPGKKIKRIVASKKHQSEKGLWDIRPGKASGFQFVSIFK